MFKKVIFNLTKVSFSKNRSEIEVFRNITDDGLLDCLRSQAIRKLFVNHMIPPAIRSLNLAVFALVSFDTNYK